MTGRTSTRLFCFILLGMAACNRPGPAPVQGGVTQQGVPTSPSSVRTSSEAEAMIFRGPGFEVTKPAGWHIVTPKDHVENLARVADTDAALAEILKHSSIPAATFSKYKLPYDDVSPSFKIIIRQVGAFEGKSPVEIMSAVLPAMTGALPNAVVKQLPTEATVSGLPAAYARIDYDMSIAGKSYPTVSEGWLVVTDGLIYLIGTGTRQDEATGTRSEIRSILSTLKIDP